MKSRSSSVDSNNSSQTITVLKQQKNQTDESLQKSEQSVEVKAPNVTNNQIRHPFNTVLKESELQVKIADLGNACWSVSFIVLTFL